MAQGQGLLGKFRQLLEGTIFRRPTSTFVAAGMRRRMDAILPHGEPVVRTIRQLLGNLSRHKTLTFVVAGVVALALVLLLLEISVRMELAKEASDPAKGRCGSVPRRATATSECRALDAIDHRGF